MIETVLHTFVIPAYKKSPYLERCVQSLLNQTVKSNIIIATSTPSAYLQNIANKYQIDYAVNPVAESSIAADWNFALRQAQTSWVTIAHQDDIYHPAFTEQVVKRSNANILIAFTNYEDVVNDAIRKASLNAWVKQTLLLPFKFSSQISNKFIKKSILAFGDPICCPSVTFHKAKLHNFLFSADYTCALDWLAWLQLAKADGAFAYIPKKLMQHRIHPGSETTAQLHSGVRKKEELQLLEQIWGRRIARIIGRLYALGHKDNL